MPGPDPDRHFLHHKAQPRIDRRALDLPQDAGGRPLPSPRHGTQNLGQLAQGILRKRLLHLRLIGGKRGLQRLGRPFGTAFEHLGVEAGDMDRIGADEPQVERVCRNLAMALAERGMAFGSHADVQNRARPAPFGIFRRGADGDELAGPDMAEDGGASGILPGGDGTHGGGGQRDGGRDRKVQPNESLKTFRAPAMRLSTDRGTGRNRYKVIDFRMFLHRGIPLLPCSILRCSRSTSGARQGGGYGA